MYWAEQPCMALQRHCSSVQQAPDKAPYEIDGILSMSVAMPALIRLEPYANDLVMPKIRPGPAQRNPAAAD